MPDLYSAGFQLIILSWISTACEILLLKQLVYFQRDKGIVFCTQDTPLFLDSTVSNLECQALWGRETTAGLVRTVAVNPYGT